MPTETVRFAAHDGARIGYSVEGQGPPVVLLHAVGLDRTIWGDYRGYLARDRTVVCVDLPGHGESDPINDGITLARMADAVVSVLRAEALDIVDLVGISMGGMIAQIVALEHPELVRSLVLCSTASTFVASVRAAIRARGDAAMDDGMPAVTVGTIERWFSPEGRSADAALRCGGLLANDDPAVFGECWYAIAELETAPRLPELRVPALVITGDADISLPADASAVLAARILGSESVVVPGGWHLGALETPGPYRHAIVSFLGRVLSSGHPSTSPGVRFLG